VTSARRDALAVLGAGLASRLAIVLWAARAFPPAADGTYYDRLARRLAEGHGYTWLWPDGVVTYAAHYPVGYPALVALGYLAFGAEPAVAMALNAVIGAAAAVAAWSLVRRAGSPRLGLAAGLAVALHPALVPYTAALMTEGVTASLLVVAAALAAHARGAERPLRWLAAVGIVMGAATLVRPQSIALAPVLALLASGARSLRARLAGVGVVTALALGVCAPWTARNCRRMDRCALVSVNGGWNLAIGTQTDSGGWRELAVPEACKAVFQEAAKDECFGREARRAIARDPTGWLRRVPAKLRVTFDYFGAAPWYLHTANPAAFPYEAKVALGAVETLASRLLLSAALVAVFRMDGGRPRSRRVLLRKTLASVGLVACVLAPGTIAYLALACAVGALGRHGLARAPLVVPATAAVVLATAATHAVFFGAGRYGLVVVPFVTALAFVRARAEEADLAPRAQ
jgi:4-amino-4-deoxy-L-arabinose transferase-like glycosyltransferase